MTNGNYEIVIYQQIVEDSCVMMQDQVVDCNDETITNITRASSVGLSIMYYVLYEYHKRVIAIQANMHLETNTYNIHATCIAS